MSEKHKVEHSRQPAIDFFTKYTQQHKIELAIKDVCDLSAGRGYIANLFSEAGSTVHAFDLFPDQNRFLKSEVKKIDLQKTFPIGSNSMDMAICCETIEHLPNQYFFFQETARILKPGGRLILTTPNTSSLRSRLSQFLMESEHYSAPAPNKLNAITYWPDSKEGYFGKLFLSGILRLRTLAQINELELTKVHPTKRSSTSVFLMILFYPWLYFFNKRILNRQLRSDPVNKVTYKTIFKLNLSSDVLLGKHLILEFVKKD
jgi:SAM-dependent methyltransferase